MNHRISQPQGLPTVIPTRLSGRWGTAALLTALIALIAFGAWIDSPPPDLDAAFAAGKADAKEEQAPALAAAWLSGLAEGQQQCARVTR